MCCVAFQQKYRVGSESKSLEDTEKSDKISEMIY